MSTNVEHLNYNNFANICRTCTFPCDIKFPPDNVILNVFYKLTDIHFETNVEFPQQICLKCFQKMNEIQEFASECRKAQTTLTKCLENLQDVDQDVKENFDPLETNKLEMEIKEEITIDEHEIEFNDVELNTTNEMKICETNFENTNNENMIFIKDENINYSEDDLLIPDNSNIDVKLEESSNSATNKDKCDVCAEYNCDCERPNKCEHCSKSFKRSYRLKEHMLTHSGERPHTCDQCSKTFARLSDLKRHVRTHSDDRHYTCPLCSDSFTRSIHLKVHMRTHNNKRSYKCEQCSKSFVRLSVLKRHLHTHSGERAFKCEQCAKSFTQSYHLKVHVRTHTGERPYKCEHCSKTFKRSYLLSLHLRTHTSEHLYN